MACVEATLAYVLLLWAAGERHARIELTRPPARAAHRPVGGDGSLDEDKVPALPEI